MTPFWVLDVVLQILCLSQVDISAAVAAVMAPKEESELSIVKKASSVTMDVFTKYLKDQLMDIIDSDKVTMGAIGVINPSTIIMCLITFSDSILIF